MKKMAIAQARVKGILLILLATLCIVLMNTCAKASSPSHGPVEMVFYRGVVALLLLTPYMLMRRPASIFTTRRIGSHLYRSVVGNVGVGLVFWAYTLLPMANATALLFAAPLFVTALSPFLLGERVEGGLWVAVVIGFCGILLISRPKVGALVDVASLVGLGAALCVALVDMALRNLGRTESSLTTVFYFLVGGVVLAAPYTILFGAPLAKETLHWMIGIGVFTAIQQLAKTSAYRFAKASFLAPYTYSSIVWATLLGWWLWKETITPAVIVGIAVVILCNFFILWRPAAAAQKGSF